MTSTSNREHDAEHVSGGPGRRPSLPIERTAAIAALLGLAVLTAGCGSSNRPGNASSESVKAQFLAYARCMRSHGVSDFPDPTTSPGGGVARGDEQGGRPGHLPDGGDVRRNDGGAGRHGLQHGKAEPLEERRKGEDLPPLEKRGRVGIVEVRKKAHVVGESERLDPAAQLLAR